MWDDTNIIFIISMPRSGSTLLQRILAAHTEIDTTSESWLLLPQIYALKENGVFSEYSHIASKRAINDFCECLPNHVDDYLKIIKCSVIECYKLSSNNNIQFYLEKTPRNNLILKEIVSMFPESKYIFLWRNPAAVVASMINSFSNGKWNIFRQEIDLYKGLENMLQADSLNIKHRYDINYEDLVISSSSVIFDMFNFLGLRPPTYNGQISGAHMLRGRMGDKSGAQGYGHITDLSLDKWKSTMSNPLRKRWLVKYIDYIGTENLSRMGYRKSELLDAILSIEFGCDYLFSDILRMLYGAIDSRCQISLIRKLYSQNKNSKKFVLQ